MLERAKRIDNHRLITGTYIEAEGKAFIIQDIDSVSFDESIDAVTSSDCIYASVYEVQPETRAIHYPNMIDKDGNKIFASLRKDGIGADIAQDGKYDEKFNGYFFLNPVTNSVVFKDDFDAVGIYDTYWSRFKLIGVKL